MGNKFTKIRNNTYFSNKTHLTDMSETKVDDSKKTDIPTKREFHQVETSTYWLPKDEDEQLRLTGVSCVCLCDTMSLNMLL